VSAYFVEIYKDQSERRYASAEFKAEREARAWAAKKLGHTSLRGASKWDRYQGGTVYQFGPHHEDNGCDFAVILTSAEVA